MMMIGRFRDIEAEADVDPGRIDAPDMRLGDVLRGERATLGKSLLDVQRELKIKATYIAAIENADLSAFESPGFIAGYVRSYARYLALDPDLAFRAFCAETDLESTHTASQAAPRMGGAPRPERVGGPFGRMALGLAPGRSGMFSGLAPGAIGSLLVLIGLIGLIGYGGYAVLNEVQKVQFVPVEQSPRVVAELDPLSTAAPLAPEAGEEDALPVPASDRFDRLYRPEALDVPVLVARDGPIATLDPRLVGALGREIREPRDGVASGMGADGTVLGGLDPHGDLLPPEPEPQVQVVGDAGAEVVLFAVRPSWVRVRSADGTSLYERIMNEGDRFVLPKTEEPATLRTGESGAIYFQVNGEPYGPAGRPGTVTGNLSLDAANLTEMYEVADLARDTALARVVVELRADPPRVPGMEDEGASGN